MEGAVWLLCLSLLEASSGSSSRRNCQHTIARQNEQEHLLTGVLPYFQEEALFPTASDPSFARSLVLRPLHFDLAEDCC